MENFNLLTIFLTGLFTGGLTCLAVQGGLLATTIAQREEEYLKDQVSIRGRSAFNGKKGNAVPILAFVISKLIAYTFLGLFLGWFGSFFELSLITQAILQIAVAIFMIGTAGALVNLHPFFRYFIIQPPKFITRHIRSVSKSGDLFSPAILGAFTVFIPCGTTQAMMALAIASGKPLTGAIILFAFILGTTPLFFILGYLATRLGDSLHKKFMKAAAYAIILLALFNLNNGIALTGSSWTFGKIAKSIVCGIAYCEGQAQNSKPESQSIVSEAVITIENNGYSPREFTVKAGSAVTLRLVNKDGYSCAQAFTIPSMNIRKIIRPGSTEVVVLNIPNRTGEIVFMCSMGMYRGTIFVN